MTEQRITINLGFCLIVFGAVLFFVKPAGADVSAADWGPVNGISIGPSAGWVGGNSIYNSFATGVEISYYHQITFPLYFWASLGARIWMSEEQMPILPYVETGLSVLLISAGAGYSTGLSKDNEMVHYINAFVGINVPIWSPAKRHLIYFLPYYRPTWNVSSDNAHVSHEIGGFIKWIFGFLN